MNVPHIVFKQTIPMPADDSAKPPGKKQHRVANSTKAAESSSSQCSEPRLKTEAYTGEVKPEAAAPKPGYGMQQAAANWPSRARPKAAPPV